MCEVLKPFYIYKFIQCTFDMVFERNFTLRSCQLDHLIIKLGVDILLDGAKT